MNATVKAVIIGAVTLAIIGSATAVLIVIITHGGFNTSNANAIAILIGLFTTQVPSILNLIKTQQIDTKVSNGLIPQKVTEALNADAGQSAMRSAMEPVVVEHIEPVLGSLTSPPRDTSPTNGDTSGTAGA
jgi:hypothetical protein